MKEKYWISLGTDGAIKENDELDLGHRCRVFEQKNSKEETDVGVEREMLANVYKSTTQSTVLDWRRRGTQRWMTEGILSKIDERRKYKSIKQERYRL